MDDFYAARSGPIPPLPWPTIPPPFSIDNNPAENALRAICLGRKNWLFAGADCGGERAAAMYSLLETAKLNGVNPQEWLANVLDRIGKATRSIGSTNCCRGNGPRRQA